MIRRLLAALVVAGGAVLAAPVAGPPATAGPATPGTVPLTVPAGLAWSLIGHSCTTPQEAATAEGFDPATGFPSAYVTMSTSCAGSGRDGGHTFSATAGIVWDDAGTVYSTGALTSTPGTGPGFTAYDDHGNEEVQTGTQVSLVWAPGFVPVPRVTGLSVGQGSTAGGQPLTIGGSGFTNASTVDVGSTPVPFTVVDDTTITVATPPVTAPGTVDVTVASPEGNSATSTADQFAYVPPQVTGLSVSAGPAIGGTTVTITGLGLTGATAVDFGGLAAASYTVTDDTTIVATTPADPIALGTDTVDTTVSVPDGTSATSAADQYTFVVAPVITSVSPAVGPITGGTPVTLTGTGLDGAAWVDFGGIYAYGTPTGDTSMTVTAPAGESTEAVPVTVTTIGGTSAVTAATRFTYRDPIACSKLTGTLGGSMTVSGCTPVATGYTKAALDPTGTVLTWSKSGRTTGVSLGTPTSPGQGSCPRGQTEQDFSGTVTGGTSTYTTPGDPIVAATCATRAGKLKLLAGTTISL